MECFNLSQINGKNQDINKGSGKTEAPESLYLAAGLASNLPGGELRPNPWADQAPRAGKEAMPKPWTEQAPKPGYAPTTDIRHVESELVRKVQEFTRDKLDETLTTSSWEKHLVESLQDSIISGDTDNFRRTLKQLYEGLAIQAVEDKTGQVRNDLRAVERNLKQNCAVDINIDVTNDDRVILRIRPENLALELGKVSDTVKRVEETDGSISLDNSKEVIRPTSADFIKSLSDRIIHGRSW